MKALKLLPATITLLTIGSLPAARAQLFITMEQVGPDVVATSTGSLPNNSVTTGYTVIEAQAVVTPLIGSLTLGLPQFPGNNSLLYAGSIVSGPASFGSGATQLASSSSGPMFGFLGASGAVGVDVGQGLAGTPFTAGTATWANLTLASLGVTPGTYVWTTSSVFNGETITLTVVPEPYEYALMAGLGLLGFAGWRRRNRA